jgi:hypothetical protein
LEWDLVQQRARYDDAVKQLAAQRGQLAQVQSRSDTERATLVSQMKLQVTQQLASRETDLAARQRHLESLEYETNQLQNELKSLQAQRASEGVQHTEEQRALRQELSGAREQTLAQQEQLDKARTDYAREQSDLLEVQGQLDVQRTLGAQNSQAIVLLNAQIKEREARIKAKDELIATLNQQLTTRPAVLTANLPVRGAEGSLPAPAPARVEIAARAPATAVIGATDAVKYLEMARKFEDQHHGQRYALLIGNANYGNLNSLQTPMNDVRDLAQILEDRYDFKVITLIDASEVDIMMKLDQYTKTLAEDDSMLIYFAGHGDRDVGPPERAFWLGVEADPKSRQGYLEVENIQAKIKQMSAKHILLVADSCFSGAIAHGSSVTVGRGINENRLMVGMSRRARMVLTSGGDTPVVDSGGDPDHSLFATFFIQTLRQNNTVMSGEMLAHELYARMKPQTAKLHISQTPTYANLSDANHDFGDFFFTPKPAVRMAALDPN